MSDQINYIVNRKDNVKVVGSSGDDWITNTGQNVTVQSGAGNDTVEGSDAYGELFLFASNTGDNVITGGANVTVEPKGGRDTVIGSDLYGELYRFSSTDGNNVIENFGLNDTLEIVEGAIQLRTKVGDDYIITFKGANYSAAVTLKGTGAFDFIQNDRFLVPIPRVNEVINHSDGVKVGGTDDADYIVTDGEHVTIAPRGGNDTIEGSDVYGEVFLLGASYGNNIITNFGKNNTINCAAGNIQAMTKASTACSIDRIE